MSNSDLDTRVRLAAFEFLDDLKLGHGELLPYKELQQGFEFEGRRVPLLGPQGIFKPAVLSDVPLTITTSPDSPYDDEIGQDGFIRYRYMGNDRNHRDNVGLRRAWERQTPLIYLFGVKQGWYRAEYPVLVIADDPANLRVTVQATTRAASGGEAIVYGPEPDIRAYRTREVQQRMHQDKFRAQVLHAYREHCAVCSLRQEKLLDAAHIIADRDPRGLPVVPNGLSLCKLHHAAFDAHLIGVRPDCVVEVQPAILAEKDGPMLIHGLQEFQSQKLRVLPKDIGQRPDPRLLEERYAQFRRLAS